VILSVKIVIAKVKIQYHSKRFSITVLWHAINKDYVPFLCKYMFFSFWLQGLGV